MCDMHTGLGMIQVAFQKKSWTMKTDVTADASLGKALGEKAAALTRTVPPRMMSQLTPGGKLLWFTRAPVPA